MNALSSQVFEGRPSVSALPSACRPGAPSAAVFCVGAFCGLCDSVAGRWEASGSASGFLLLRCEPRCPNHPATRYARSPQAAPGPGWMLGKYLSNGNETCAHRPAHSWAEPWEGSAGLWWPPAASLRHGEGLWVGAGSEDPRAGVLASGAHLVPQHRGCWGPRARAPRGASAPGSGGLWAQPGLGFLTCKIHTKPHQWRVRTCGD